MHHSKAVSSLDAAVRRHSAALQGDISAFVLGTLSKPGRAAFVSKLAEDRALRLAVGDFRKTCEKRITVSEQAHSLLAEVLDGLHQSSSLFPGDPYIAGIENRPDIAPSRERWLNHTIEHADKLVALGELEDVALENKFRAQQNINNARRAQKEFGRSTAHSAMEGALEAAGREHWESIPTRYEPYYLPPPPQDPAPLKFLINGLSREPRDAARVASRLGELWGGEPGYYYKTGLQELPKDQETWQAVVAATRDSAPFREAIGAYLALPFTSPEPLREIFGKLVGARLLLNYAETAKDSAAIKPVTDRLVKLIDGAQKTPLEEHSHDLAEGLTLLLTLEGNSSDVVWTAAARTLFPYVDQGIYGIPLRKNTFRDADRTIVDALTKPEKRLASDPALQKVVLACARGRDIPARYEAIGALVKLPPRMAVVQVLGQVAVTKDHHIKNSRGYSDDYPLNTIASGALLRLAEQEEIRTAAASLTGVRLPRRLQGCATFTDAVERLYLSARDNPERKKWDSGAMTRLLEALYHLDTERALPLIKEHFTKGPQNHYGHYPFIYMVRDLGLRQFVPDMIQQLASSETIGRDGHRVIVEVLEELGYRKAQIGEMVAAQGGNQVLRSGLRDLANELSMPITAGVLRAAVEQGVSYDSIWALRLARGNSTQRELEAEHVRVLIGILPRTESSPLGYRDELCSLAKDAAETLSVWLAGPSKALVSREIDRAFEELSQKPRASHDDAATLIALGALRQVRDQLNSGTRPESTKLEPGLALQYLLVVIRPPAEVVKEYLLSYSSKTSQDLTPSQKAARCYVRLALGESAADLHQMMLVAPWTNRKALISAKDYQRRREDLTDADDFRYPSERPLHRINTAAIGLMSSEIPEATEVFQALKADFEEARATYDRFNDDKIEPKYLRPLVGALVRLGDLTAARGYLAKFQVEELGPINGILDVAIQAARSRVAAGSATKALDVIEFARSCLKYLPRSERDPASEMIETALKTML